MAETLFFEIRGGVWEASLITVLFALVVFLLAYVMQLELIRGVYLFYRPFAYVAAPLIIVFGWGALSWQIVSVVHHFSSDNLSYSLIFVLIWTILYVPFNFLVRELLYKKKMKDELSNTR